MGTWDWGPRGRWERPVYLTFVIIHVVCPWAGGEVVEGVWGDMGLPAIQCSVAMVRGGWVVVPWQATCGARARPRLCNGERRCLLLHQHLGSALDELQNAPENCLAHPRTALLVLADESVVCLIIISSTLL